MDDYRLCSRCQRRLLEPPVGRASASMKQGELVYCRDCTRDQAYTKVERTGRGMIRGTLREGEAKYPNLDIVAIVDKPDHPTHILAHALADIIHEEDSDQELRETAMMMSALLMRRHPAPWIRKTLEDKHEQHNRHIATRAVLLNMRRNGIAF